ncbi:MAG: polysaccharide biosynthesis/export family protein [Myxococcota bacterium]
MLASPGCSDPPPSEYPEQEVYLDDTTLGPGDVFEVRVFRQDEMTGTYRVNSEGTIWFPLIGVIEVKSKTPIEVEGEIRRRLAEGYLRNPQVSLLVKEYNSKTVSIFGQVRRPGTLTFTAGMTVVDAVAQAGGFADLARKNAVRVTRVEEGKKQNFIVPVRSIGEGKANNFFIRPGDTVFVPRRLY